LDFRDIVDVCKQMVVTLDGESIVYANKACVELIGINPVGESLSYLFDNLTVANVREGNILVCQNEPVHIDRVSTKDYRTTVLFSMVGSEFGAKKNFLDNQNMFVFTAIVGGAFTYASKPMSNLLGISSHELMQNDGWSKLAIIFSDLTISRNTVVSMFTKETRGFLTTVKTGEYEGTKIYWSTILNEENPESKQILAMGIRIPEEIVEDVRYDKTFEVDGFLNSVHLPLAVLSKNGIEYLNLIQRVGPKRHDAKTTLADKIAELIADRQTVSRIVDLIEDIASGVDRNISIKANVKTGVNTSSQLVFSVLPVRYKGKRCALLLGAPFGGYVRQTNELTRTRNLLDTYEVIHEVILEETESKRAITRILEFIYNRYRCECVEIHTQDEQKIKNVKLYGKKVEISGVELSVLDKTFKTNVIQISNNITEKRCSIVVPFIGYGKDTRETVAVITLNDANQETIEDMCRVTNFARVATSIIGQKGDMSSKAKVIDEMETYVMELQSALNHDMKTPLTSIIGYSELLLQGILKDESERKQAARSVIDAAKNLEEQMNQLALSAKKLTSMTNVNLRRIDVGMFMKEIASLMVPLFESKMIEFQSCALNEQILAKMDYEKLKMSVLSVLQNAVEYTPMGGRVECDIKKLSKDFFQLTISDNGPGIPNKKKEVIFRKILKNKALKDPKGLSLHKCMLNIRAMGGRIWFESPGDLGGTTFYIVLPSIID